MGLPMPYKNYQQLNRPKQKTVTELTSLTANQRYEMIVTECDRVLDILSKANPIPLTAADKKSNKLLSLDTYFL